MSEPLLPPGLPLPPSIQESGIKVEVLGIPNVSERIEEPFPEHVTPGEGMLVTVMLKNSCNMLLFCFAGSVRIYTVLKVLYQSPSSSVYMCNWHSSLRPKEGSSPLIEIARFGGNSRLIALKSIGCPTLSTSNFPKRKELDVRYLFCFVLFFSTKPDQLCPF